MAKPLRGDQSPFLSTISPSSLHLPTMSVATIDNVALLKATLHAAAHPDATVLGVLVGTPGDNGGVRVTDALPLFHTGVAAPMLEVALAQV